MNTLQKIIKSSKIVVHEGKYAYLKAKKVPSDYFMVSKDVDEMTVVVEENDFNKTKYSKSEKWFKLFEIKVSKPFLGVGFIAAISKAIADKKLNVLVVSTFSKDYLLLREKTYKTAVKALEDLGFQVKIEK